MVHICRLFGICLRIPSRDCEGDRRKQNDCPTFPTCCPFQFLMVLQRPNTRNSSSVLLNQHHSTHRANVGGTHHASNIGVGPSRGDAAVGIANKQTNTHKHTHCRAILPSYLTTALPAPPRSSLTPAFSLSCVCKIYIITHRQGAKMQSVVRTGARASTAAARACLRQRKHPAPATAAAAARNGVQQVAAPRTLIIQGEL